MKPIWKIYRYKQVNTCSNNDATSFISLKRNIAFAAIKQKKSAETISIELLEKFQIQKKFTHLIKMLLTKLFNHYNENNLHDDKNLESEYKTLKKM